MFDSIIISMGRLAIDVAEYHNMSDVAACLRPLSVAESCASPNP